MLLEAGRAADGERAVALERGHDDRAVLDALWIDQVNAIGAVSADRAGKSRVRGDTEKASQKRERAQLAAALYVPELERLVVARRGLKGEDVRPVGHANQS